LFQLRFCYSRSSSTGDNNEKVGTTSAITPSDTQLSTLVTSKDINPKEVAWTDIVGGGKLLAKPGEAGQMVKLVVTICCIDAMLFNMEQLQQICSNMKLMGYQFFWQEVAEKFKEANDDYESLAFV